MLKETAQEQVDVTIKFAGDSGDGMQLTGKLFTENTALFGNDLATFPDFPSEIRAPIGTIWGVSGFQLHFGSRKINTPGDRFDVLVAMNAAALKSNISSVKKTQGCIIVNTDGFDSKNLRLAKYTEDPLENNSLDAFEVIKIPVTKITKETLQEIDLGRKDKERCKNMFVLGYLLWRYDRDLVSVVNYLNHKFQSSKPILDANIRVLKSGYHFAETHEAFRSKYRVEPAELPPGTYRGITGTTSLLYGLVAASQKSGLSLFYGSYPITPASDILHGLSELKHFGIKTFQAEDEIAGVCAAIGASYGGSLAVTGTSGPGLALKSEALGLAIMLELPLVIVNVQRGGPSTGLPTKTEQSDLLMALYGRSGECPAPVLAASSPDDAFEVAYEACKMAIEHMTPVFILSDGYISKGAVPWKIPNPDKLPSIKVSFAKKEKDKSFFPYQRNEDLVRPWAIPGTPDLMHQIGGLEKEHETGHVSYDSANHHFMVKTRQGKVDKIADNIPALKINVGKEEGDILILGWGSTFGVIESSVNFLLKENHLVSHAHLRYIAPLPTNLKSILGSFKKVIIPEINNGQLSKIIREKFLIPVIQFNQIKGRPFYKEELISCISKHLEN